MTPAKSHYTDTGIPSLCENLHTERLSVYMCIKLDNKLIINVLYLQTVRQYVEYLRYHIVPVRMVDSVSATLKNIP